MKSVVIYESMYGNTHQIATAIAQGVSTLSEVVVIPVGDLDSAALDGADLVVVGGPTHAHGISRSSTRKSAVDAAQRPSTSLTLEPNAAGVGLRDWFDVLGELTARSAAFDTRTDLPTMLTGRASRAIAKRLKARGADPVGEPESFLVDRKDCLLDGESERARLWGEQLVNRVSRESLTGAV